MTEQTIPLYDANKGLLKRTGGPYLDEVERNKAEERRAVIEDREPDLENPPAIAGTQLVPKQFLRENDTDHSHAALGGYVELENEPEGQTVYVEPENNPDPTQADWDHDSQKLAALQAEAAYADVKAKTETVKPAESDLFNE